MPCEHPGCAHGGRFDLARSRGRLVFFNDPAPTEISTLSLHDALPISNRLRRKGLRRGRRGERREDAPQELFHRGRSEEHTSELQSQSTLVCRLLLEKTTFSGTPAG